MDIGCQANAIHPRTRLTSGDCSTSAHPNYIMTHRLTHLLYGLYTCLTETYSFTLTLRELGSASHINIHDRVIYTLGYLTLCQRWLPSYKQYPCVLCNLLWPLGCVNRLLGISHGVISTPLCLHSISSAQPLSSRIIIRLHLVTCTETYLTVERALILALLLSLAVLHTMCASATCYLLIRLTMRYHTRLALNSSISAVLTLRSHSFPC